MSGLAVILLNENESARNCGQINVVFAVERGNLGI